MTLYPILAIYGIYRSYTFSIGGYYFGFVDAEYNGSDVTLFHAGPLGHFYHVPFTAGQGVMITALLVVALLSAFTWLCFRRRRLATNTE